ncbi:MAG: outer membrane protein [Hyphomicrobiaceae bacterium]
MKFAIKAACASTALVAASFSTPAMSADMYGGSVKDGGYMAPLPQVSRAAGPCYVRGDVGYGWSQDGNAKFDVFDQINDHVRNFDAGGNLYSDAIINTQDIFIGNNFVDGGMDDFWFGEVGVGCGSGSRGLRGDVTFGFRQSRDFWGTPLTRTVTHNYEDFGPTIVAPGLSSESSSMTDAFHTNVKSYSLLFNGYYDLGNFRGFVPYVGAGIGVSYNIVDDVTALWLPGPIEGDKKLSFAWQVSTGVGYQIRENMILDLGYRYLDLGSADSGQIDGGYNINPEVRFDDLRSHEIKVGLRYHFGSRGNCCDTISLK